MRLIKSALVISALSITNTVFAAAFQTYELGTPVIGTAAVGQAAIANDASTSYFNPAGMTRLPTPQFMLGSEIIFPNINFSIGNENTISGNNGGNAGSLTPGVGLYYVYSYSPKIKFGVSLTSPYIGELTYNDGWVGRYTVQQTFLYTLNLNPSVAYEVTRWLSLGAGVVVEYANLSQTVALPVPTSPDEDGQANIKLDNYAPGFNLGAMLTPSSDTRIGIAYRSQVSHDLEGNTTFLKIAEQPETTTNLVMPQNVIISLSQAITNRFNLLGELGWSDWSSMQRSALVVQGYSVETEMNWHDTYRAGLGGQYLVTPAFILQAGVSYDSSPTDSSMRTPNLPMDRQIRAGLGLLYTVIPAVQLGFSYEYINFGDADINNSAATGVLQGYYPRNFASVAQASINVSC